MSVLSSTQIINNMLFKNLVPLTGQWEPNSKWGFLVHKTMLPMIRKYLKRFGIHYLFDISDYELKIGEKLYDMKLIYLTRKSDEVAHIMHLLVPLTQFTFYWDRRTNLFSTCDQFHELQEFISRKNLTNCVISKQLYTGVNSKDQPIIVVFFNKKVNYFELLENFWMFLQSKPFNAVNYIYHYYVTFAFPWQQPSRLHHFDIPFKNSRVFLELQTFLTCMRELSYEREPHLDFFGLCSLKLAFCDDRNITPVANELEFEIVALIERSLKRMVRAKSYIENSEFNLEQYAIDRNCEPYLQDLPAHYFLYRLQEFFQSVRRPNMVAALNFQTNLSSGLEPPNISLMPSVHVHQSIKLVEEANVLQKLNDKPNARFIIDGENYPKMNHKLFCDIISCRNVDQIVLDTNYQLLNLNTALYRADAGQTATIIYLIGKNKYNFVERFITALAKVLNSHNLRIVIATKLEDYRILRDLNILEIMFTKIELTSAMLIELHDCNLKRTMLSFVDCTIESNIKTWELLNELNILFAVIIQEDNTWQYIFEYISDHLIKLQLMPGSEFKFKIRLGIEYRDSENKEVGLDLNKLKFTIDELKTRLEIRNSINGDLLDLYYLKNPRAAENHNNENVYEFYK